MRAAAPPRPLLVVPNVTPDTSTASVPITVLLYNSPLLCGFNVPIKGYGRDQARPHPVTPWNISALPPNATPARGSVHLYQSLDC